jgi:tetratricopeptide (TPR) repeat protein
MWIPSIFLDYVRGIRPRRIVPVLDHHAQDVIGLFALMAAMARVVLDADAPAFDHASDHWGVSSLLQAAGREEESLARLERAILAARDEDLGFRLSMHLAKRFARAGREAEAVEIWRARAPMARPPDRLEPLIALARHYERGARDLEEARRWAERALAAAERDAGLRELLGVAAGVTTATGATDAPGTPRSEEARALDRLSLLIEGLRRRVERIDRRRARPPREPARKPRRPSAV